MIHIDNIDQADANGFDRNDVFNSSAIDSFEFDDLFMRELDEAANNFEWRMRA